MLFQVCYSFRVGIDQCEREVKDKDRNSKRLKIIFFLRDDISGIGSRIDMNQKPV